MLVILEEQTHEVVTVEGDCTIGRMVSPPFLGWFPGVMDLTTVTGAESSISPVFTPELRDIWSGSIQTQKLEIARIKKVN